MNRNGEQKLIVEREDAAWITTVLMGVAFIPNNIGGRYIAARIVREIVAALTLPMEGRVPAWVTPLCQEAEDIDPRSLTIRVMSHLEWSVPEDDDGPA